MGYDLNLFDTLSKGETMQRSVQIKTDNCPFKTNDTKVLSKLLICIFVIADVSDVLFQFFEYFLRGLDIVKVSFAAVGLLEVSVDVVLVAARNNPFHLDIISHNQDVRFNK